MRPLHPILEKLSCAQTAFLRTADSIRAEQWRTKPKADEWSAAELVAHLVMVERAIIASADRITQKTPRAIPFLKRFHFPMWAVESRVIRLKSPIPLDPSLLNSKEEMLGELRAARERTLAFLEETQKRDLSVYCWRHPFLGMLNGYEWFELIASHEIRHTKQMREIAERLQKAVESA
ncbi:MAG TPA: DinB family protein [Candidatus Acidoferrum sp.]